MKAPSFAFELTHLFTQDALAHRGEPYPAGFQQRLGQTLRLMFGAYPGLRLELQILLESGQATFLLMGYCEAWKGSLQTLQSLLDHRLLEHRWQHQPQPHSRVPLVHTTAYYLRPSSTVWIPQGKAHTSLKSLEAPSLPAWGGGVWAEVIPLLRSLQSPLVLRLFLEPTQLQPAEQQQLQQSLFQALLLEQNPTLAPDQRQVVQHYRQHLQSLSQALAAGAFLSTYQLCYPKNTDPLVLEILGETLGAQSLEGQTLHPQIHTPTPQTANPPLTARWGQLCTAEALGQVWPLPAATVHPVMGLPNHGISMPMPEPAFSAPKLPPTILLSHVDERADLGKFETTLKALLRYWRSSVAYRTQYTSQHLTVYLEGLSFEVWGEQFCLAVDLSSPLKLSATLADSPTLAYVSQQLTKEYPHLSLVRDGFELSMRYRMPLPYPTHSSVVDGLTKGFSLGIALKLLLEQDPTQDPRVLWVDYSRNQYRYQSMLRDEMSADYIENLRRWQ